MKAELINQKVKINNRGDSPRWSKTLDKYNGLVGVINNIHKGYYFIRTETNKFCFVAPECVNLEFDRLFKDLTKPEKQERKKILRQHSNLMLASVKTSRFNSFLLEIEKEQFH